MRNASLMKKEVSDAIDVLLVRAIRESFTMGAVYYEGHAVFICKDEIQLANMKRLEFGMRKSITSASGKELETMLDEADTHIKSIWANH